ncbi:MAG: OmpH family outer membrane protein [Thermoanaerobaculia bacterium]|nr:OmpH family outer membrane protein [Thermoanaerobaculia bacterium]
MRIMRGRVGLLTLGLSLTSLCLTGGFATAALAQDGPIKIAVVDLDRVIAQSKAGKELQTKLEKFQQDIKNQGEAMNEEARQLRQRMTDGVNSLSEDKLAELQKQFEDKQIAMRRFRDDKQREGQKMQEEGLREIEKQLQPVFEKVRDDGGYDLILNYVPGVVVMAGERIDITKKVVETLNATGN